MIPIVSSAPNVLYLFVLLVGIYSSFKISSPWEFLAQDSSVGRSWAHLLCQTHWICNYTWSSFPWNGPARWLNRASTRRDKREALRWIGEAETQSHTHTHPPFTLGAVIQNGEVSKKQKQQNFPLRSEGFMFHIRNPQILCPAVGEKSSNAWDWKTMGIMSRRP